MGVDSINLSSDQFNRLFPFYMLIDHQLKVQSVGKSLEKLCGEEMDSSFSAMFNTKRPKLNNWTKEVLDTLLNQLVILEFQGDRPFLLRGQFEYLADRKQYLFVGSPWFDSINEIKENNLTILDFAIHDAIIDLLHVLMTQKIATDEVKELLSKVNQQKNSLRGINTFSADLLNQVTLDEIAWTIIDSAIKRFDLEDCVIYLLDEDGTYLSQRAVYGAKQNEKGEIINPMKIRIGDGIVGKVASTGKALIIDDTTKYPEYIPDDKVRYSELTVPIIADDKVIGIIDSEHSRKNFFTNQHLTDFRTIANLAAIKIKNAVAQEKQLKVEKELSKSRKRFEDLMERAGETLYKLNSNGYFTFTNPVFYKKTGYKLEELKKKKYWELVIDSHKERTKKFYAVQMANRVTETYYEMPISTKDGKVLWVGQNVTFNYTKDGKLIDSIAVARDISEKRLAEIALKQSEKKYRGIIANMELGIVEVDLDERIQFVNQSFCKMSGYSVDELVGNVASEVLLSPDGQALMKEKSQNRKRGISDAYEIKLTTRDDKEKWWLISGGPSYDNSGNLIGSIGIHLDITSQKKLEKALKQARIVAEESSKAKEYFLANMSHEIRTPLNAILGMLRELSKSTLSQDDSAYTKNALTAADHLLSIVNDILDVSKIEAGQFKLEKQNFQLKNVIDSIEEIMSIKATNKNLDLIIDFSYELHPAHIGDSNRIRQILINIVDNAIKFTKEGSVSLKCDVESTDENVQWVQLSISDTGVGMEKEYLENLFDKFSQEDRSTSRLYGGTGLGMAITFDLVQLMGGNIDVSSEKGKGSRFDVKLPLPVGNVNKIVAENPTYNDRLLQGKRILLVEDNPMNRLVAGTVLSNYKVHVTEAENGLEAIEKVESEDFDVILMDVQMPVMDGLAATKIIRKTLKKDLPIIALTANAFKQQINECLSVGMNGYVVKPYEESVLIKELLKVIVPSMDGLEVVGQSSTTTSENNRKYDLTFLEKTSNGDQEFLANMIRLFMKTIPPSIDNMRNAFDFGDFKQLSAIAHRIKQSLSDMGIKEIAMEIKEVELLADKDPNSELLPKYLSKIEGVMEEVIHQLSDELG